MIKGIDSYENTSVNQHFVREAIPHGNISYTPNNPVNMIIQTFPVPKSRNRLDLIYTHY